MNRFKKVNILLQKLIKQDNDIINNFNKANLEYTKSIKDVEQQLKKYKQEVEFKQKTLSRLKSEQMNTLVLFDYAQHVVNSSKSVFKKYDLHITGKFTIQLQNQRMFIVFSCNKKYSDKELKQITTQIIEASGNKTAKMVDPGYREYWLQINI